MCDIWCTKICLVIHFTFSRSRSNEPSPPKTCLLIVRPLFRWIYWSACDWEQMAYETSIRTHILYVNLKWNEQRKSTKPAIYATWIRCQIRLIWIYHHFQSPIICTNDYLNFNRMWSTFIDFLGKFSMKYDIFPVISIYIEGKFTPTQLNVFFIRPLGTNRKKSNKMHGIVVLVPIE